MLEGRRSTHRRCGKAKDWKFELLQQLTYQTSTCRWQKRTTHPPDRAAPWKECLFVPLLVALWLLKFQPRHLDLWFIKVPRYELWMLDFDGRGEIGLICPTTINTLTHKGLVKVVKAGFLRMLGYIVTIRLHGPAYVTLKLIPSNYITSCWARIRDHLHKIIIFWAVVVLERVKSNVQTHFGETVINMNCLRQRRGHLVNGVVYCVAGASRFLRINPRVSAWATVSPRSDGREVIIME